MSVLRNRKKNHISLRFRNISVYLLKRAELSVQEINYDVFAITKMVGDFRTITLVVSFIPTSSSNPFHRPLIYGCFFVCGDNAEQKNTDYIPPKVCKLQPASFSIEKFHEN
jgi:hypothetical protein